MLSLMLCSCHLEILSIFIFELVKSDGIMERAYRQSTCAGSARRHSSWLRCAAGGPCGEHAHTWGCVVPSGALRCSLPGPRLVGGGSGSHGRGESPTEAQRWDARWETGLPVCPQSLSLWHLHKYQVSSLSTRTTTAGKVRVCQ